MGEEEKILQQIARLEEEHTQLKGDIPDSNLDQFTIQRHKKRKLWIKDEISRLYAYLEPDIIA